MCYLHLSKRLFPMQCEGQRNSKAINQGLWSIHPHDNHLIIMLKGIKEIFIHSPCWACLIDYLHSPYVSLSPWTCISDCLQSSSACYLLPLQNYLEKGHTHKVIFYFYFIILACICIYIQNMRYIKKWNYINYK